MRKKLYRRSAFSFTFAHYHCFRYIRSKSQTFLQSIDMVTHSVCTTRSIIEIIIRADNLQGPQVCGKTEAYVKPSNRRFIILLFYHILTILLLRFPHTSFVALSERSIRIFPLFRSVRPSHIFRVRSFFAMWHEGLIVEFCQIQSA